MPTHETTGMGAPEGRQETPSESRATPRAVDLRRGRAPEVVILACATYDFLLALHVVLASPEYDYADYDIGRAWVESARARCTARDPEALPILGRYLGDGRSGSLHATLISLVWQCPEPRMPERFLTWLATLPPEPFVEALIDSDGLGADWLTLLHAALGEPGNDAAAATEKLLARYPDDQRPTVHRILADVEATRAELLRGLRAWYASVFAIEEARVTPLLQREAEAMERQRADLPLEPFIEQTMRGVQWQRPAGLRRIVFAPSYFCRPAVFYHFWHDTLTFCVPVEHTSLDTLAPSNSDMLDEETLRFFVALGDPTRLRILRLLVEREMYLTELAEHLGLTKATTKHHMVRLRAAGLVTLYDRERLTYYALRPDCPRQAAYLLEAYLAHAPGARTA